MASEVAIRLIGYLPAVGKRTVSGGQLAVDWASASPCGWAFAVSLMPATVTFFHELGRAFELQGVHFYWVLVVYTTVFLVAVVVVLLYQAAK